MLEKATKEAIRKIEIDQNQPKMCKRLLQSKNSENN
jgi:hypothetical protein